MGLTSEVQPIPQFAKVLRSSPPRQIPPRPHSAPPIPFVLEIMEGLRGGGAKRWGENGHLQTAFSFFHYQFFVFAFISFFMFQFAHFFSCSFFPFSCFFLKKSLCCFVFIFSCLIFRFRFLFFGWCFSSHVGGQILFTNSQCSITTFTTGNFHSTNDHASKELAL